MAVSKAKQSSFLTKNGQFQFDGKGYPEKKKTNLFNEKMFVPDSIR